MSLTSHLGYGPFQLFHFLPGDLFARHDGTLARICDPQPPGRPDHVQVWTLYGTSLAKREWLHCTALAYAVSEEDAWIIERRRKGGDNKSTHRDAEPSAHDPEGNAER